MEDISDNEIENSSEEGNVWGLNYQNEKNLWETKILKYYSYNPRTCPLSLKGDFILKEHKDENILNPFYLRCTNTNYQKQKLLRAFTFFNLHKNIPASILLEIINLFLIIKLNAKQKHNSISSKIKKTISYVTIYNILFNIRKVIADYLKHEYWLKQIGGDLTLHKIVAIEESLFFTWWIRYANMAYWTCGYWSKTLRLDIVKDRTAETLKTFVYNHIEPGTFIVHYGWPNY